MFARLRFVSQLAMVIQPLRFALLISAGLGFALAGLPLPATGQADLRSSFPGRKVGGGDKGGVQRKNTGSPGSGEQRFCAREFS